MASSGNGPASSSSHDDNGDAREPVSTPRPSFPQQFTARVNPDEPVTIRPPRRRCGGSGPSASSRGRLPVGPVCVLESQLCSPPHRPSATRHQRRTRPYVRETGVPAGRPSTASKHDWIEARGHSRTRRQEFLQWCIEWAPGNALERTTGTTPAARERRRGRRENEKGESDIDVQLVSL